MAITIPVVLILAYAMYLCFEAKIFGISHDLVKPKN